MVIPSVSFHLSSVKAKLVISLRTVTHLSRWGLCFHRHDSVITILAPVACRTILAAAPRGNVCGFFTAGTLGHPLVLAPHPRLDSSCSSSVISIRRHGQFTSLPSSTSEFESGGVRILQKKNECYTGFPWATPHNTTRNRSTQ